VTKEKESVVDWFTIITQLGRYGIHYQQIALEIGTSKTAVHNWKMGSQPTYILGEKLIDLWLRVTQQDKSVLPRVTHDDWMAYHCPR
jgi:hypothetical protein